MSADILAPVAPYVGPPPDARPAQKPCVDCGADLMRERHVRACPQNGEIRRLAFEPCDPAARRLEQLLADSTRRAWRAWARAGYDFPGAR